LSRRAGVEPAGETPSEAEGAPKDPGALSSAITASRRFLEGLSPETHFSSPVFGKVLPSGIGLFNQRNLLLAPPYLELFFAADRTLHVAVGLVINEPVNFIFPGEAFNGIHLVLRYAAVNIPGNADIERPAAAYQNVNPEFVIVLVAHGERC
jgi:hypothetical protein